MTSHITTAANTINALYPVPGQDNDSQGFRDNFSAIQTSLLQAATEITALQTYSAQTTTATNFNGNLISGAVFVNNSDLVDAYNGYAFPGNAYGNDNNLVGGGNTIVYSYGGYFIAQLTTSTTYNIIGFPTPTTNGSSYARFRLHLMTAGVQNSATWTVGFTTNVIGAVTTGTIGAQNGVYWVKNTDNWTGYLTTTYTPKTQQIFEIWTFDGGYNLYVDYKGVIN